MVRFYIVLIPLMEVRYFGFEILPELNVDIKNNHVFYTTGKIYHAYQVHVSTET